MTSQAALWGVGLTIYGLALVATFGFSAGYHIAVRPKLKALLRRLDHAAIFLMIAGTYTPFVLIKMNNAWGLGLLATVWTMAAIGIAIKLFAPRHLDSVSTALYLVQGWAVLAVWEPLMSARAARYGYRIAEIPASEPPRIGGERSFNLLQWAAAYYLQFLIEFVGPKKPSRFKTG